MTKMNMFRAAVFAGALAVPMAATTSAQPAVIGGGGLVNVQIGTVDIIDNIAIRDVLNANTVTVGIGVAANLAANICGVAVGVLAQDLARGGDVDCQTAEQFITVTQ